MSYQGSALVIECPRCGDRGSKKADEIHRKPYCWSKDRSEFFQRIAGRDLYYRSRGRKCLECGHLFETVEMASTYLDGLMNEIERLEGEIEKANKKLIHTKNFIEKLIEV